MDKSKKILGQNRNVFFLGLVSFFTDLSSEMILPILPSFMNNVLRISKDKIGLIEGLAETVASFLKLFSGWLADKIKKKKILVVMGYTLSNITKPFFAFASNWLYVLLIRFTDRIGKGIRTSPRDALIADSTKENERGKAYGFHRMMDTMGAVFGTGVAALFLFLFAEFTSMKIAMHYKIIFLLSLIPGIFAVLILILFVKETFIENKKIKQENILGNLKNFDKPFWIFIIATSIFELGNFSYAFYMIKIGDAGVPLEFVPLAYLTYNIFYTFIPLPIGILSDKYGEKIMLIFGYLFSSIVAILAGMSNNAIFAWLIFVLYAIPVAFINTVPRSIVSNLVSSENRGLAFGIYYVVIGLFDLPASFIAGVLWEKINAFFAFSFSAILSFLAAVIIILFFKKEK